MNGMNPSRLTTRHVKQRHHRLRHRSCASAGSAVILCRCQPPPAFRPPPPTPPSCWSTSARRRRRRRARCADTCAEFLHDHRVVELTALAVVPAAALRDPAAALAGGGARNTRASGCPARRRLAAGGAHARRLAQAVQRELPQLRVVDAMRYGEPALAGVLDRLRAQGVRRVLVLPLYPQYSTTTTASVGDVLRESHRPADADGRRTTTSMPAGSTRSPARSATHGHAQAAASTCCSPSTACRSVSSMPAIRMPRQCEASARAIAQRLGLDDGAWTLSYQSRFGREQWLEPSTAATLRALARTRRAPGRRGLPGLRRGLPGDAGGNRDDELAEDFARAGGDAALHPLPQRHAGPCARRWRRSRSASWQDWR